MQNLDENYQAAFNLLTGAQVREAFDISAEPASMRDLYGRHEFGQSTLLARRLVERGVTFVTVNTQPWDHHGTAIPSGGIERPALHLTPAQRRVCDEFLKGHSEKEVAALLKLSLHTVHTHSKAIYKTLAVASRAELLARCAAHPQHPDHRETRIEDIDDEV